MYALETVLLSVQLHAHPNTHMYTHTHTHTQWEGTALHAAADCGHADVVELLLEAEADPDVQNEVCTLLFSPG